MPSTSYHQPGDDSPDPGRYCPICGGAVQITDSRALPDNARRRRWRCARGHSHTTVEMPLRARDLRKHRADHGQTAVTTLRAEILEDASAAELLTALAHQLGVLPPAARIEEEAAR